MGWTDHQTTEEAVPVASNGARTGTPEEAALRGLVERGVVSPEQAAAVLDALRAARPDRPGARWAEIVGYVGGGLVLAGAAALVATSWDVLSETMQVVLLAAVAVAALGGALVMAGGPGALRGRAHRVPDVRRRVAGTLSAVAAAATALAVGVGFDADPPIGAFAAGLVVAAAGYALLPSAVGLVASWVLGWLLVGSVVGEAVGSLPETEVGLPLGLALIANGLGWAALGASGVLAHRRLALGLGAGLALAGAHMPTFWGGETAWGYGLTLAVAAACLAAYRWEPAGVLLVFGVLGITVAVPEAVWDLTDGAVTVAAVLLLAGAILLVASWTGVRLHRGRRPAGTG
jgi:hypothetical protein